MEFACRDYIYALMKRFISDLLHNVADASVTVLTAISTTSV